MPRFIPAAVNLDAAQHHFRQRYARGTASAGARVQSRGACAGLSVSWIHALQTGAPLAGLPSVEGGVLAQYRFVMEYHTYCMQVAGDASVRDGSAYVLQSPPFQMLCHRMGLRMQFLGEHLAGTVIDLLAAFRRAPRLKTFALAANRHATAIAMAHDEVAFFDSNVGITLFSKQEALDLVDLEDTLARLLCHGPDVAFGVSALTLA